MPPNKRIIFFSAQDISDKRKGYLYFNKIIKKLSNNKNIFFLSLGENMLNLKKYDNHKHIDYLPNEETSELYSLSDIFLCTSLIDNLPLTILEAISSGNLVISFDNGGAKEVLKNIGYCFKISELNKLIKIIKNIKSNTIKRKSVLSRKFALKNLTKEKIGKQYKEIFNKIYRDEIS